MADKAPWITYRPQLKVLDCTIRDGGLINKHQFTDEFVRAVYETCLASGIDYMEVGYKNSPRLFAKSEFGAWRHCDEEDLNRVFAGHDDQKTGLKLAAMADATKSDWREQLVPREQSVLDMIRVAFYAHQVSEAVEMIQYAHDLGYETSANLMAVSNISEVEIDTVLEAIAPTQALVMVIVDSFGHLYREQIDMLYKKYSQAVSDTGKDIGIHAAQQPAIGVRQHDRGDHHGRQPGRCHDGRPGTRSGQLPDGTAAGFLAEPQVQVAAGRSSACRTRSSRCGKSCCGDRWCPTTSPVT